MCSVHYLYLLLQAAHVEYSNNDNDEIVAVHLLFNSSDEIFQYVRST